MTPFVNPGMLLAGGISFPFSAVKLLCHAEADPDTSTDDNAHSMTTEGGSSHTTSAGEFKFGSGAFDLAGGNDRLQVADTLTDFNVNTGDWTCEAWMRRTGGSGVKKVFGHWNTTDTRQWHLWHDETDDKFRFEYREVGGTVVTRTQSDTFDWPSLHTDAYVHVATCRFGSDQYVYVNGSRIVTFDVGAGAWRSVAAEEMIFGNDGQASDGFQGQMDEDAFH